MTRPNVPTSNSLEMSSIRRAPTNASLDDCTSAPSSLRSSLDNRYYQSQDCDVHIYDDAVLASSDATEEQSNGVNTSSWYGGPADVEDFKQHLKVGISLSDLRLVVLIFARPGTLIVLAGCEQRS